MEINTTPARASGAEHDNDEIDLLQYWQIVRDRRWVILGAALAGLLLALALSLLATPIFRASSMLQIERDTIKLFDFQGLQPTESPNDRDFYQTQYELLKSRSLAQRVIQDLDLTRQPLYRDRVEDAKKAAEKAPNGKALTSSEQEQLLIGSVLDSLRVEPVRNSRLVSVGFDSPDPQLAARVSNAYADAFIATNLERKFEASAYAKKYLEERLAQLKGRLEDSEKALVDFSSDEQIVSLGDDKPSLSAQNLGDLNASLAKAQDERIKAESEWREASAGDGLGLPQVVANGLVQSLRTERTRLAADYQEKLGTFKPDYPDMQRLSGQIRELDRQIAGEIGHVRSSVRSRYQAAIAQETLLTRQITALKGEVLDLQGRSIKYNILKREADTNRQMYDALLQRYKEIGVAGGVGANNISIIDRASVPKRPASPRIPLNLAMGLLVGLMLGTLLAFLLHYLDRSISTPKELADIARLPVLGAIPKLAQGVTPAQAAADIRSAFAESYRSVRTALQFATSHGLPRSLLLTSAGPTEGKSTSAMELARNIAQLGKRVLLLDADLRNPSVHQLTRLPNAKGLSSVLAGAQQLGDVVQRLEADKLDVVTAGPIPPNPPELLAGEHFGELLAACAERYDVVVIDGPPVLGLADAPLLANVAESTLLVVAAGETSRDAVTGAQARLAAAHARVTGTLLVRYDPKDSAHGYGYAYYAYGGSKD